MVLQQIKRNPAIAVDRHDLAVNECAVWQIFTSSGDRGKLRREIVTSPGPEPYAAGGVAGEAPIAIELDLVEPVPLLRELANRERVHRFDEVDFDWLPSHHSGIVTGGKSRC